MARRLSTPTAPAWKGDLPVYERTFSNGLKALVLPRSNAPVVVSDLYYPAGSVNEPAGQSGLAHFVEHMLFKGTARLGKGQIDRLAFAAAGSTNAETSEDFTHYWFTLPADRWELALEVEADRMTGALFDNAEVEAERQVIAEERAGDLDSPLGRLDEAFLLQSYVRHPYRNPILGWPEDMARLSVDDLKSFYRMHYRPDGAVLVVVGDIEPIHALDRIEKHFASIPRGVSVRPTPPTIEPRQLGRRDFQLIDSDAMARGILGWHSVPVGHPDAPALSVLGDLLCCGRRSRLWDRLVERDRLVTWIDAGNELARFAGQFLIQVEASQGVGIEAIEATIAAEVAELADSGPTPEELARSRRRLDASWRWEQDDLSGLAGGLGPQALWDDWRNWQAEHRAAIMVTETDIRRVASAYLVESGITVGWSLPRPARAVSVLMPAEAAPRKQPTKPTPSADLGPLPLVIAGKATRLTDYAPVRTVLPNGLRILTERRKDAGVVALEIYLDAGSLRELKPGVAALTGRLLDEGTTTRSAEALAAAIEDVGGGLEVGSTGVSVRVKAEDLPLAVELMADVILRPAFPADALAWTKRRIVADIQGDRDDPTFRAEQVFRALIYGKHPYGRDSRGGLRDLARLTLDDIQLHHSQHFRANRAIFAAAGDFDPRQLRSLVKTHFGRWQPATEPVRVSPRVTRGTRPRVRRVVQAGNQVHLLIGHLGVTRRTPQFEALCILDQILGAGPGFTDRLSRILRDELGLTYAVGGSMTDTADLEPGLLRIYLGTSPEDAERAVAAVVDQVRALHAGEFSDDEVEQARRYLAGSWVFDYQTVEQRADNLLELERLGLPLDSPVTWPDRIAEVTPAQVRKAAKLHLNPDALTRVEFGPILGRGEARVEVDCA